MEKSKNRKYIVLSIVFTILSVVCLAFVSRASHTKIIWSVTLGNIFEVAALAFFIAAVIIFIKYIMNIVAIRKSGKLEKEIEKQEMQRKINEVKNFKTCIYCGIKIKHSETACPKCGANC